jgi:hypothetical protein
MMDERQKITNKPGDARSINTPLGNIEIDYDLLGKELEGSNLSEDEKKEFIDCICWIMLSFVDLGFGIDPNQQALHAGNSKRTSTSLPFLDVIMDTEIAGEFNSKNKKRRTAQTKETMTEGLIK